MRRARRYAAIKLIRVLSFCFKILSFLNQVTEPSTAVTRASAGGIAGSTSGVSSTDVVVVVDVVLTRRPFVKFVGKLIKHKDRQENRKHFYATLTGSPRVQS